MRFQILPNALVGKNAFVIDRFFVVDLGNIDNAFFERCDKYVFLALFYRTKID